MSQRDPLGRESYSELMNEWAEKRNVMLRMQGGILHPPAYLSPAARLLGYLWRIALVAVVVLVATFLLVRSHIRGADFSEMVGTKVGVLLHAHEVKIEPFWWKRSTGSTKNATFKGSSRSFFLEELRAEGFRFKLPIGALFRSAWQPADVFISELTADIRPGIGGAELGVLADVKGAWGINPDLSQLKVDRVEVADANLTWGLSSFTRGTLKNAQVEFTKSDGKWQLLVREGTLSQNYLRDLQVTALKVGFFDGEITFSDGEFTLGKTGKGTFAGTIRTGEYPELDLTVNIEDCDVQSLLPRFADAELAEMSKVDQGRAGSIGKVREILFGKVDAAITISGSTNRPEGIRTTGTLRFNEEQERSVRILSMPLFSDLGGLTGNGYLRRPEVSGGTLSFQTGQGVFTASAINLQLGQSARLMGGFSYGIAEETASPPADDTTGTDSGAAVIRDPIDSVPVAKFGGEVQFGVHPSALANIPEEIQRQFFPDSREDMIWMSLPLEGSIAEATAERGMQLVNAVKAAGERR